MSKKNLLTESTIRRFWRLANIPAINEQGVSYMSEEEEVNEAEEADVNENEDIEEVKYKREDKMEEAVEDVEEGMGKYAREDEPDMGEPPMDDEPPMGDEPEMDDAPGGAEAEVDVTQDEVEALEVARDVIDRVLQAGAGGAMDEPDMGEPPMDDEPAPMQEIDTDRLEEMVQRIADKVSKRLVKEALIKKIAKK